ncbi:substrate-binding domain-containing protein [Streptomyces sp. AC512_CC834]|uniref:substrate-binding domain-containing protein n=1 Tax=Streptomyces sp. AC512_CC834 TaxID=2823691 RepID=UPI001C256F7D|nr:substrate-binding domain-containing protein [Streptomyces sp. AC512_CC834]
MNGVPWESLIAVLGLAVPVTAALWEFFLAGRKRLGYRVQMDTSARDSGSGVPGPAAGVLQSMQWDGVGLADPSVVLLRIENVGWTPIVEGDYVARADDPVGIRAAFPGRRVVGMVVTECSHPVLRDFFEPGTQGLGATDGVITLPKVKLNRRAHYKVLAVLDRVTGAVGDDLPGPEITAGIVGGVRGGTIKRTEYYPFASRPVRWLLALLVLVSTAQSVSTFVRDDDTRAAPLDCAEGTLHLSGSTAFQPVLERAAEQYVKTCPGARIPFTDNSFKGSVPGLDALASAGGKAAPEEGQGLGDRLAFSDGPKSDGRPQLLPRPVALSLFTLVVNKDAGVRDLSLEQVRRLYAGEITNWNQVKGNDLPVHLVSRNPGSGTRTTLQEQVLDGEPLPATLEGADQGAYPYWQTEIAYTYGEPPADSIAAGFLRYLANEVGKDIIRAEGHRPCSELDKPLLCRPSGS